MREKAAGVFFFFAKKKLERKGCRSSHREKELACASVQWPAKMLRARRARHFEKWSRTARPAGIPAGRGEKEPEQRRQVGPVTCVHALRKGSTLRCPAGINLTATQHSLPIRSPPSQHTPYTRRGEILRTRQHTGKGVS